MELYVGNLPYSATEADLRQLFEQCGPVLSAKVVADRETGRSKGFGFVQMDDEAAKAAVQKLNGQDLGGRALRVNEARGRDERPARNGGGGQGGERRQQRW